jgi:aquaporin Z
MRAEAVGTFVLVFGGCGTAVLAVPMGVGLAGVSLAFGLTVLAMAYAVGHLSGGHFNPAVTLGLSAARRFPAKEVLPYWAAQVLGALLAAGALHWIASGQEGWKAEGFASNGYEKHSPGGYSLAACAVTEALMTMVFLVVILGSTDRRAPKGFAPLAIGLSLTLIHLISIPVTNTSVNPARSTGPAAFVGGWALEQLWLFWAAPLAGALAGALLYRDVAGPDEPA